MTLASSVMANARKTQKTCNWPSFAKASEGEDGKNRAMLRSTLQTGSFAKIAHRAIFKRSSLAGAGTLLRFGDTASSTRSAMLTAFFAGQLWLIVDNNSE
jgi:hypothetical protein